MNTVFTAMRRRRARPSGSPVFGFTSSFGKFDDETSSRMRCPRQEQVRGREQRDADACDLARPAQARVRRVLGIAQPHDPVGQDHRVAARVVGAGRMHVDQLGGEVGVRPVGGDEQFCLDRPHHLHRRAQRLGLEHQHVGARGKRQVRRRAAEEARRLHLVPASGGGHRLQAAHRPADRRHRVRRVEIVRHRRGIGARRRTVQPAIVVQVERHRLGLGQRPVGGADPASAVLQFARPRCAGRCRRPSRTPAPAARPASRPSPRDRRSAADTPASRRPRRRSARPARTPRRRNSGQNGRRASTAPGSAAAVPARPASAPCSWRSRSADTGPTRTTCARRRRG